MERPRVSFLSNGNTLVTDKDGQRVELQVPWFKLYLDFLADKGVDPTALDFYNHGGTRFVPFAIPDEYGSWNWHADRDGGH